MRSLFSRLSTYSSTDRVRPIENFSSELLGWLVEEWQAFGCAFAGRLLGCGTADIRSVTTQTQRQIPTGFIDLWCTVERRDGTTVELLIENKIDSGIGWRVRKGVDLDANLPSVQSVSQIRRYIDFASGQSPPYVVRLLTKYRAIDELEPDVRAAVSTPLRWHDISDILSELAPQIPSNLSVLVEECMSFLDEQQLSLQPVGATLRDGTKQRKRFFRVCREAAERIADDIAHLGVHFVKAGADEEAMWVDWRDSRDHVGGLVYSDEHSDTAICLKGHRYGTERAIGTLRRHPRLSGLVLRKPGRFWNRPFLQIELLDDAFFAMDAEDQVAHVRTLVRPVLEAVVSVSNDASL